MLRQFTLAAALASVPALAYDVNVYWGQKGTTMLREWCDNAKFDYVTIGFVNNSPENDPSKLKYPGSNFAAHCAADKYTDKDGKASLLLSKCTFIAEDIPYCQSKGKKVLLSIGGAIGNYDVTGKTNGEYFGDFMYDAFGPYNPLKPEPRPFDYKKNGNDVRVVVDGFDFDIEHRQASGEGYVNMIKKINDRNKTSLKKLLVTAAPECPLSDEFFKMKNIIDGSKFDAFFVQFYNNPSCDGNSATFNYNKWVDYLKGTPSSAAKIFLGLPGDSTKQSAGSGYMQPEAACNLIKKLKSESSKTFGGVMLWDIFTADGNDVSTGVSYLDFIYKCVKGSDSSTSTSTTKTSTTKTSTTKTSTTKTSATTTSTTKTSTTKSSTTGTSTSRTRSYGSSSTTSTGSSTSRTRSYGSSSTTSTSSSTSRTRSYGSSSTTSTGTSTSRTRSYGSSSTTSTDTSTSRTRSYGGSSTTSSYTRSATTTTDDDDYCTDEPGDYPSYTCTSTKNTHQPTYKPSSSSKSTYKPTYQPSASSKPTYKPTGKPSVTKRPPHVTYVTLTTSVVYTESCETITPTSKGGKTRVVTHTVAVSTTVCPVTITEDNEPTYTRSWPAGYTTSTIYATKTRTLTYPGKGPYATTEIVAVSTTVCPISDIPTKPTGNYYDDDDYKPKPDHDYDLSTKVTKSQFTTLTVPKPDYPASSVAPVYSKPYGGPDVAKPAYSEPYPAGTAAPTYAKPITTSTAKPIVQVDGAARNSVALGLTGVVALLFLTL